ncbi:MAG TPA: hypothetical protein VF783_10800, partial [Terriglobales bacterium]
MSRSTLTRPSSTSMAALGNPAFATAVFVALYTFVVYPVEGADVQAHSAAHGAAIHIEDVTR